MHLIYSKTDGQIFREAENIGTADGMLAAGFGGNLTMRYHPNTNATTMEISDEKLDKIKEDFSKYLVKDGEIVENPDWKPAEELEI